MKNRIKTLDLAFCALGAVLIAVCSWISIPTTIPFTLQTFAVFTVLGLLGGLRGTVSVVLYIALGAVGVPVFAGFSSGVGILLGNTGGYIIGFVFLALIYWGAVKLFGRKLIVEIIAMVIGCAVVYAFGTAWFMLMYTRNTGEVGLYTVMGWCVFPFIIPDAVKLLLAVILTNRVRPVIEKINR